MKFDEMKQHIGEVINGKKILDVYRSENNRVMVTTMCVKCGVIRHPRAEYVFVQKKKCLCDSIKYVQDEYYKPLMSSFRHMKDRCYNKNHHEYHNYGGKGVIICDEWKNDFNEFRRWSLEAGYEIGLTIDRIDHNGNYEPSNCQWISRSENTIKANKTCQHRKANKGKYYAVNDDGTFIEFDNANKTCSELGIKASLMREQLYRGKSPKYNGWTFGYICDLTEEQYARYKGDWNEREKAS